MKDTTSMNQIICNDFSVDLISESPNCSLFAALKKGGTERIKSALGVWETHVSGVWHVVTYAHTSGFEFIQQWHIPRYKLASSIQRLNQAILVHPKATRPILDSLADGLNLALLENGKLGLRIASGALFSDIKPSFLESMRQDLPLLDEAREKVKEKDGKFYLPRAKTPASHPVEDTSRDLIEAIAFEQLTLKGLNAGNFGVYSAFCTYRDFDTSIKMPDSMIEELVENQLQHDPQTHTSQELMDIFMAVQSKLFPKPIWGRGVQVSLGEACNILSEAMVGLTRTQRVQFILMNGMHAAGILLPLAVISGFIGFDRYAEYMSRQSQPDSPEEQDLRKETAYIQLYGELA